MHRKFISLVLSAALAITGMSAAPARADDRDKWIAGAAALAILGLAIHEEKKSKRKRKAQQYYYNQNQAKPYGNRGHSNWGHNYNNNAYSGTHGHAGHTIYQHKPKTKIKPRFLPRNCRVTGRLHGHQVRGLALGCLKRNSVNVKALPQQCRVKVRNPKNGKRRVIFGGRCLRENGYRLSQAH